MKIATEQKWHRKFRRAQSLFTLAAFLVTNQLSLPPAFALLEKGTGNTSLPVLFSANDKFPQDISQLQVPAAIGKIEEVHQAASNKPQAAGNCLQPAACSVEPVVILIQDAHAIPEAQRNIQKLIEHFQKEYGVGLVALEGAASELDPQMFKSFPDKEKLKRTFNAYFENAELTGTTAAAIFSELPAIYHGIENWKLYEEGLSFYLKAMGNEPALIELLQAAGRKLQEEKEKIYSKKLLEVDKALEVFKRNDADLVTILMKLKRIQIRGQVGVGSSQPVPLSIQTLLEEIEKEGEDQSAIEREVRGIAEEIKKHLLQATGRKPQDYEEPAAWSLKLAAFNQKYQEFQTSRISPEAFALFMKELLESHRHESWVLSLEKAYSRLTAQDSRLVMLMNNHKRLRDIEGTQFFRDFEAYVKSVKELLFRNQEERNLDVETRKQELLKKLTKLELSREEWEEIKTGDKRLETGNKGFVARDLFHAHLDFYDNAEKRDNVFLKNLLKLMPQSKSRVSSRMSHVSNATILIAGGFHTEGLARQFKEKGISYAIVRPEIKSIPEQSPYRQQMQGNVSWKEYFEVKSGKVNLYEAFVRGARDRLLGMSRESWVVREKEDQNMHSRLIPQDSRPILKTWRDQILRDLAVKEELTKAGQYTQFLDEITQDSRPKTQDLNAKWLSKINRFISGLRKLESTRQLTESNVLRLLQPATYGPPEINGPLAPASNLSATIRAEVRSGEQEYRTWIENATYRKELRTIENEIVRDHSIKPVSLKEKLLNEINKKREWLPRSELRNSGGKEKAEKIARNAARGILRVNSGSEEAIRQYQRNPKGFMESLEISLKEDPSTVSIIHAVPVGGGMFQSSFNSLDVSGVDMVALINHEIRAALDKASRAEVRSGLIKSVNWNWLEVRSSPYREEIVKIQAKKVRDYSSKDFERLNWLAGELVKKNSPLQLRGLFVADVLNSPQESILNLASAASQINDEPARVLFEILSLAQKVLNVEAHRKQGSSRKKTYEHSLDLVNAALQFEPQNKNLLTDKATLLSHLGDRKKALEMFRALEESQGGNANAGRAIKAGMGHAHLELGRVNYKEFVWALERKKSGDTYAAWSMGMKELAESEKIILTIISEYEESRANNMKPDLSQIPRSLTYLASIAMLRTDFYLAVAAKAEAGQFFNKEAPLLALYDAVSALGYSIKALRLDENNPHSDQTYKNALQTIMDALDANYASHADLSPTVLGKLEMLLNKMENHLSRDDYAISREALSLIHVLKEKSVSLKNKIKSYRIVDKAAKEGMLYLAGSIKEKAGAFPYDQLDQLKAEIEKYVAAHSNPGVAKRQDIFQSIWAHWMDDLKFNLTDFAIVGAYVAAREKDPITIAETAKEFVPHEVGQDAIIQRLNNGRYYFLGVRIKNKKTKRDKVQPDKSSQPSQPLKLLKAEHVRAFLDKDAKDLKELKNKYRAVVPWITDEEFVRQLKESLDKLTQSFDLFRNKANALLEAQTGKKAKMSKEELSQGQEELKTERFGADGQGGYWAFKNELAHLLDLEEFHTQRQINERAFPVVDAVAKTKMLQEEFDFNWVESVKEQLEGIHQEIRHLTKPRHEHYLSESSLDDLLTSAKPAYEQILSIYAERERLRKMKQAFTAAGEILQQVQPFLTQNVRTDLEDQLESLKEEFSDAVLSPASDEPLSAVEKELEELSARIKELSAAGRQLQNDMDNQAARTDAYISEVIALQKEFHFTWLERTREELESNRRQMQEIKNPDSGEHLSRDSLNDLWASTQTAYGRIEQLKNHQEELNQLKHVAAGFKEWILPLKGKIPPDLQNDLEAKSVVIVHNLNSDIAPENMEQVAGEAANHVQTLAAGIRRLSEFVSRYEEASQKLEVIEEDWEDLKISEALRSKIERRLPFQWSFWRIRFLEVQWDAFRNALAKNEALLTMEKIKQGFNDLKSSQDLMVKIGILSDSLDRVEAAIQKIKLSHPNHPISFETPKRHEPLYQEFGTLTALYGKLQKSGKLTDKEKVNIRLIYQTALLLWNVARRMNAPESFGAVEEYIHKLAMPVMNDTNEERISKKINSVSARSLTHFISAASAYKYFTASNPADVMQAFSELQKMLELTIKEFSPGTIVFYVLPELELQLELIAGPLSSSQEQQFKQAAALLRQSQGLYLPSESFKGVPSLRLEAGDYENRSAREIAAILVSRASVQALRDSDGGRAILEFERQAASKKRTVLRRFPALASLYGDYGFTPMTWMLVLEMWLRQAEFNLDYFRSIDRGMPFALKKAERLKIEAWAAFAREHFVPVWEDLNHLKQGVNLEGKEWLQNLKARYDRWSGEWDEFQMESGPVNSIEIPGLGKLDLSSARVFADSLNQAFLKNNAAGRWMASASPLPPENAVWVKTPQGRIREFKIEDIEEIEVFFKENWISPPSRSEVRGKSVDAYGGLYRTIRQSTENLTEVTESDLDRARSFLTPQGTLKSFEERRANEAFGMSEVYFLPDSITRDRMTAFQKALKERFKDKVYLVDEDKLHLTLQGLRELVNHSGKESINPAEELFSSLIRRASQIQTPAVQMRVSKINWNPSIGIFWEVQPYLDDPSNDPVMKRREAWGLFQPRPPHVTAAYLTQPFTTTELEDLKSFIAQYQSDDYFGDINVSAAQVIAYEDLSFNAGYRVLTTIPLHSASRSEIRNKTDQAFDSEFEGDLSESLRERAAEHLRDKIAELREAEKEGRYTDYPLIDQAEYWEGELNLLAGMGNDVLRILENARANAEDSERFVSSTDNDIAYLQWLLAAFDRISHRSEVRPSSNELGQQNDFGTGRSEVRGKNPLVEEFIRTVQDEYLTAALTDKRLKNLNYVRLLAAVSYQEQSLWWRFRASFSGWSERKLIKETLRRVWNESQDSRHWEKTEELKAAIVKYQETKLSKNGAQSPGWIPLVLKEIENLDTWMKNQVDSSDVEEIVRENQSAVQAAPVTRAIEGVAFQSAEKFDAYIDRRFSELLRGYENHIGKLLRKWHKAKDPKERKIIEKEMIFPFLARINSWSLGTSREESEFATDVKLLYPSEYSRERKKEIARYSLEGKVAHQFLFWQDARDFQSKDPRKKGMYFTDFTGFARSLKHPVKTNEKINPNLAVPFGPRQLIALRMRIEEDARWLGIDPKQALGKIPIILSVNKGNVDAMIEDLTDEQHNFYGFSRDNVYFTVADEFYGRTLHTGIWSWILGILQNFFGFLGLRLTKAGESPLWSAGHGYKTAQLAQPGMAFRINEDKETKDLVDSSGKAISILDYLESRGTEIMLTHHDVDLTQITRDALDLGRLAKIKELIGQTKEGAEAGVVTEMVANPNNQAGGYRVLVKSKRTILDVQAPSLNYTSIILETHINEAEGWKDFFKNQKNQPYNAFRNGYAISPLKKAIMKYGIPVWITFSEGYLYPLVHAGDLPLNKVLGRSNKSFMKQKKDKPPSDKPSDPGRNEQSGEEIHDVKGIGNLTEATDFIALQDQDPRFLKLARDFGFVKPVPGSRDYVGELIQGLNSPNPKVQQQSLQDFKQNLGRMGTSANESIRYLSDLFRFERPVDVSVLQEAAAVLGEIGQDPVNAENLISWLLKALTVEIPRFDPSASDQDPVHLQSYLDRIKILHRMAAEVVRKIGLSGIVALEKAVLSASRDSDITRLRVVMELMVALDSAAILKRQSSQFDKATFETLVKIAFRDIGLSALARNTLARIFVPHDLKDWLFHDEALKQEERKLVGEILLDLGIEHVFLTSRESEKFLFEWIEKGDLGMLFVVQEVIKKMDESSMRTLSDALIFRHFGNAMPPHQEKAERILTVLGILGVFTENEGVRQQIVNLLVQLVSGAFRTRVPGKEKLLKGARKVAAEVLSWIQSSRRSQVPLDENSVDILEHQLKPLFAAWKEHPNADETQRNLIKHMTSEELLPLIPLVEYHEGVGPEMVEFFSHLFSQFTLDNTSAVSEKVQEVVQKLGFSIVPYAVKVLQDADQPLSLREGAGMILDLLRVPDFVMPQTKALSLREFDTLTVVSVSRSSIVFRGEKIKPKLTYYIKFPVGALRDRETKVTAELYRKAALRPYLPDAFAVREVEYQDSDLLSPLRLKILDKAKEETGLKGVNIEELASLKEGQTYFLFSEAGNQNLETWIDASMDRLQKQYDPAELSRVLKDLNRVTRITAILHHLGISHGDLGKSILIQTQADAIQSIKLIDFALSVVLPKFDYLPEEYKFGGGFKGFGYLGNFFDETPISMIASLMANAAAGKGEPQWSIRKKLDIVTLLDHVARVAARLPEDHEMYLRFQKLAKDNLSALADFYFSMDKKNPDTLKFVTAGDVEEFLNREIEALAQHNSQLPRAEMRLASTKPSTAQAVRPFASRSEIPQGSRMFAVPETRVSGRSELRIAISHDVREDVIAKLKEVLGEDQYAFYLSGFSSIDIMRKGISKASAMEDYFKHNQLERAIYFGDEFYEAGNKKGNDITLLEASAKFEREGKKLLFFSTDQDPDSRTEAAREQTIWIGSGSGGTKEILHLILEGIKAGKQEVLIQGKGPDKDKSAAIRLDELILKGALVFDADGTILEGKEENFSNQPEIRKLFAGLLQNSVRSAIISGNSKAMQKARMGDALKAAPEIQEPRLMAGFEMYVNGGATRIHYDTAGQEQVQHLSEEIPDSDIQKVAALLERESKHRYGLNTEEVGAWKAFFQFDGQYGERPDFPGVKFVPWWNQEKFTPVVIEAEQIKKADPNNFLVLTEPYVEVRDNVQVSLKLFPKGLTPEGNKPPPPRAEVRSGPPASNPEESPLSGSPEQDSIEQLASKVNEVVLELDFQDSSGIQKTDPVVQLMQQLLREISAQYARLAAAIRERTEAGNPELVKAVIPTLDALIKIEMSLLKAAAKLPQQSKEEFAATKEEIFVSRLQAATSLTKASITFIKIPQYRSAFIKQSNKLIFRAEVRPELPKEFFDAVNREYLWETHVVNSKLKNLGFVYYLALVYFEKLQPGRRLMGLIPGMPEKEVVEQTLIRMVEAHEELRSESALPKDQKIMDDIWNYEKQKAEGDAREARAILEQRKWARDRAEQQILHRDKQGRYLADYIRQVVFSRSEVRERSQMPTFFSSRSTRLVKEGTAILTTSSTPVSLVSTFVSRSLTSLISSRRGSTTSVKKSIFLSIDSNNVPTWLGVKLSSIIMKLLSNIQERSENHRRGNVTKAKAFVNIKNKQYISVQNEYFDEAVSTPRSEVRTEVRVQPEQAVQLSGRVPGDPFRDPEFLAALFSPSNAAAISYLKTLRIFGHYSLKLAAARHFVTRHPSADADLIQLAIARVLKKKTREYSSSPVKWGLIRIMDPNEFPEAYSEFRRIYYLYRHLAQSQKASILTPKSLLDAMFGILALRNDFGSIELFLTGYLEKVENEIRKEIGWRQAFDDEGRKSSSVYEEELAKVTEPVRAFIPSGEIDRRIVSFNRGVNRRRAILKPSRQYAQLGDSVLDLAILRVLWLKHEKKKDFRAFLEEIKSPKRNRVRSNQNLARVMIKIVPADSALKTIASSEAKDTYLATLFEALLADIYLKNETERRAHGIGVEEATRFVIKTMTTRRAEVPSARSELRTPKASKPFASSAEVRGKSSDELRVESEDVTKISPPDVTEVNNSRHKTQDSKLSTSGDEMRNRGAQRLIKPSRRATRLERSGTATRSASSTPVSRSSTPPSLFSTFASRSGMGETTSTTNLNSPLSSSIKTATWPAVNLSSISHQGGTVANKAPDVNIKNSQYISVQNEYYDHLAARSAAVQVIHVVLNEPVAQTQLKISAGVVVRAGVEAFVETLRSEVRRKMKELEVTQNEQPVQVTPEMAEIALSHFLQAFAKHVKGPVSFGIDRKVNPAFVNAFRRVKSSIADLDRLWLQREMAKDLDPNDLKGVNAQFIGRWGQYKPADDRPLPVAAGGDGASALDSYDYVLAVRGVGRVEREVFFEELADAVDLLVAARLGSGDLIRKISDLENPAKRAEVRAALIREFFYNDPNIVTDNGRGFSINRVALFKRIVAEFTARAAIRKSA